MILFINPNMFYSLRDKSLIRWYRKFVRHFYKSKHDITLRNRKRGFNLWKRNTKSDAHNGYKIGNCNSRIKKREIFLKRHDIYFI